MSNSLAVIPMELVREWLDKNLPLTQDKMIYGSNKIVCRKNSDLKVFEYTPKMNKII